MRAIKYNFRLSILTIMYVKYGQVATYYSENNRYIHSLELARANSSKFSKEKNGTDMSDKPNLDLISHLGFITWSHLKSKICSSGETISQFKSICC